MWSAVLAIVCYSADSGRTPSDIHWIRPKEIDRNYDQTISHTSIVGILVQSRDGIYLWFHSAVDIFGTSTEYQTNLS